ncbi:MAG TPA: hypothetical protein VLG37_01485 [Candidatus Saccharimonadales bacterium]|nr:hypothetical protein [Candidatus Saccharimonadales bacterium]
MANIYLNEFDRFMSHGLKPLAYLRYGDDWLCFVSDRSTAFQSRGKALQKLAGLSLDINPKVDHVAPTWKGIAYLGVDMWPNGRRLQLIVQERVNQRIDSHNVASYRALVATHQKPKRLKELNWRIVKDSS